MLVLFYRYNYRAFYRWFFLLACLLVLEGKKDFRSNLASNLEKRQFVTQKKQRKNKKIVIICVHNKILKFYAKHCKMSLK